MLEYQGKLPRYQPTAQDRAWRRRRFGYYGLQIVLFLLIIIRLGPNLFLFHSPFAPSPASYVQYTNVYVPLIAALKAYNRDFGQLPELCYLPPQYLPPNANINAGEIGLTTSITFEGANNSCVLEYEFSPGAEGWKVYSPRYDGPLPAPLVPAAPKPVMPPVTQPATQSPLILPTTAPNAH